MIRLPLRALALIMATILLSSCAMKVAPSGGPRDTTPTEVLETTPADGARNVTSKSVSIAFTDYVDRSVRNAVVVQPKTRFASSYSGDEIDVEFQEDLLPNTTYTVTIGTDWRDLRGNSPTRAVSVTFSTGADIDTGVVSGTLFGQNLKNARVFLYPFADTLGDAFSPSRDFPPYIMPVGSSGAFRIAGLRDGTYRVVALEDGNGNDLLDANERYSMAPFDVTVLQGASPDVNLLLGPSLASMQQDTVVLSDTAAVDTSTADSTSQDSTVQEAPPGSIEGVFRIETDLKGPYLLRFKERSGAVAAVVRVQNGESWNVAAIAAGTYSVDLVIDANQNDRYDHGRADPFTFAERWLPLDLSVSVRQRWTTEDVQVVVK